MSKDTESQHSEASPQHTPEPWVWDGGMICHDTADGGVELVAYFVRGYTTDSDLALITAAPDLLAFAEHQQGCSRYDRSRSCPVCDGLRQAAIAKAKP